MCISGYRRRSHDTRQLSRRDHANPVSDRKEAETPKRASADPKQIQLTIHIHGAQKSAAKPKTIENKASKDTMKVKKLPVKKPEAVEIVKEKTFNKQSDGARSKTSSHSLLREFLDRRPIFIIRNNVAASEKKVTPVKAATSNAQSTKDKQIKSKNLQSVTTMRISHIKKSIVNGKDLKHSNIAGDINQSHKNEKVVSETAKGRLKQKAKTIPKNFGTSTSTGTTAVNVGFQSEKTHLMQKGIMKTSKQKYLKKAQKESPVKTVTNTREKTVTNENVQKDTLFQENQSGMKYDIQSYTQGGKTTEDNLTSKIKVSKREQMLKPNVQKKRHTKAEKNKPLHDLPSDHVSSNNFVKKRDPIPDTRKSIEQQIDINVSKTSATVTPEGSNLFEIRKIADVHRVKKENKNTAKTSQQPQTQTEVSKKLNATGHESRTAGKEGKQGQNSHSSAEQSEIQQQVKLSGQTQAGPTVKVQASYDPVLLSLLAMMIQRDAQRFDSQRIDQSRTIENYIKQAGPEISPNSATTVNINEHNIPGSVLEQLQSRGIDFSGANITSPGNTAMDLRRSVSNQERKLHLTLQDVLKPKYGFTSEKKRVQEVHRQSAPLTKRDGTASIKNFHDRKNSMKVDISNTKSNAGNQAIYESQNNNLGTWESAAHRKGSQSDRQADTANPSMSHKTDLKGPLIQTKISVETQVINPNSDKKQMDKQIQTSRQSALDVHDFHVADKLKSAARQNPKQMLTSTVHTDNKKQEFHSALYDFLHRQDPGNVNVQNKTFIVETITTKPMIPNSWLQSNIHEGAHQLHRASHNFATNDYKLSGSESRQTRKTDLQELHFSSQNQYETSGPKLNPPTFTSLRQQQYLRESKTHQLGSSSNQPAGNTRHSTPMQEGMSGSILPETRQNQNSLSHLRGKPEASQTDSHTPGIDVIKVIHQILGSSRTLGHDMRGPSSHQVSEGPVKHALLDSQTQQKQTGSNHPRKVSFEPHVSGMSQTPSIQDHGIVSNIVGQISNKPATNVATNLQVTSYTSLSKNPSSLGTTSKGTQTITQTSNQPVKSVLSKSDSQGHAQVTNVKQSTGYRKYQESNLAAMLPHSTLNQIQNTQGHHTDSAGMKHKQSSKSASQLQRDTSGLRHDQQASSILRTNIHVGQTHPQVSEANPNTHMPHLPDNSQRVQEGRHTAGANMIQFIQQSHDLARSDLHQVLAAGVSPSARQSITQANHSTSQAIGDSGGSNIDQVVQQLLGSSRNVNQDLSGYNVHEVSQTLQTLMTKYGSQTQKSAKTSHQPVATQQQDKVHTSLPTYPGSRDQASIPKDRLNGRQKTTPDKTNHKTSPQDSAYSLLFNNPSSHGHAISSQETLTVGQRSKQTVKHVPTLQNNNAYSSHTSMPKSLANSAGSKGIKSIGHISNQLQKSFASTHPQEVFSKSFSNNPRLENHGTVPQSTHAVDQSPYHSLISQLDLRGSVGYQTVLAETQQKYSEPNTVHSAGNQESSVPTQRSKLENNTRRGSFNPQTSSNMQQKTAYIGPSESKPFTSQTLAQRESSGKAGARVTKSPPFQSQTKNYNNGNRKDGIIDFQYLSHTHKQNDRRSGTLQAGATQLDYAQHNQHKPAPRTLQEHYARPSHIKQSIHDAASGTVKADNTQSNHALKSHFTAVSGIVQTDNSQSHPVRLTHHISVLDTSQAGRAQSSHVKQSHYTAESGTIPADNVQFSGGQPGHDAVASGTLQTGMLQYDPHPVQHTTGSKTIQKGGVQPSHVQQSHYQASVGTLQAGNTQRSDHTAASGTINTGSSQSIHMLLNMHFAATETPQKQTVPHGHTQPNHPTVGPGIIQTVTAQPRLGQQNQDFIALSPLHASVAQHSAQPSQDLTSLGSVQAGKAQPGHLQQNQHFAASRNLQTGMIHLSYDQPGHDSAVPGTLYSGSEQPSHIQQNHKSVSPRNSQAGKSQHTSQPSQHTAPSEPLQAVNTQLGHVQHNQYNAATGASQSGRTQSSYVQHSQHIISKDNLQAGHSQPSHAQTSSHISAPGISQAGYPQSQQVKSQKIHPSHDQKSPSVVDSGTFPAVSSNPGYVQHTQHSPGTLQLGSAQHSQLQTSSHTPESGTPQSGYAQSQQKTALRTFQTGSAQPSYIQRSDNMAASRNLHADFAKPDKQHIQASWSKNLVPTQHTPLSEPYNQQTLTNHVVGSQQNHKMPGTLYSGLEQPSHIQQNHKSVSPRNSQAGKSQHTSQPSQHTAPSEPLQAVNTQLGHVQHNQYNAATGASQSGRTQSSKHKIPVSWLQNIEGTGSNYPVPNSAKGINLNILKQQGQSAHGKSSNNQKSTGNIIHSAQLKDVNNNQQTVHGANNNRFGIELPGGGAQSIHYAKQPTNVYPTNKYDNQGPKRNAAESFPSQIGNQYNNKRKHHHQQGSNVYDAFPVSQPYKKQSTVQDVIATGQQNTGASVLGQHAGSGSQTNPDLIQQPAPAAKRKKVQLLEPYHSQQQIHRQFDPQISGSSAVLREGHAPSNHNNKGQFNIRSDANRQDGQVNRHTTGASNVHETGQNGPYLNQQLAAQRAGQGAPYHNKQGQFNSRTGPSQRDQYQLHTKQKAHGQQLLQNWNAGGSSRIKKTGQNYPHLNQQPAIRKGKMQSTRQSQQKIHQQFDAQNSGPNKVHKRGQSAINNNNQGQLNLEPGANKQGLYQSQTHSNQEIRGQQSPQNGLVNSHEAATFRMHGIGQNYAYLNEQPAARKSEIQSSGHYQSQQQFQQQFDTPTVRPSAQQSAGPEALYHNNHGQFNPRPGPSEKIQYQSQTHSNQPAHGLQSPQKWQVKNNARGGSKVYSTGQNGPYVNRQQEGKRSKIQSPGPYQDQLQTNQRFNNQNFGLTALQVASQETSHYNPRGKSNTGSNPSQHDSYQSKTHSSRDGGPLSGQELPQNGQVNSHAAGTDTSKVHGNGINNPYLNQQPVAQRREMQPSGPYQDTQSVDQLGQNAPYHNTQGHYNSRSASQQNSYQSQRPAHTARSVASQNNHEASHPSQLIPSFQEQRKQNSHPPLKQSTGSPRTSSFPHTAYPSYQGNLTIASTDPHHTGQTSIQPNLHNQFNTDTLTTKLPNKARVQYPTNQDQRNLPGARGMHHTESATVQHNINARYLVDRVKSKLPKSQGTQNAKHNLLEAPRDQMGTGTQNNEPYYLQEVITSQYKFEKSKTLLPKPKQNKRSQYQSTADVHGPSGYLEQGQIVESARLLQGKQSMISPQSTKNNYHEPQHNYITSRQTGMEQNTGIVGKQTGKPLKRSSSSHSGNSKQSTGQAESRKAGLGKAALVDTSQQHISKRNKVVKPSGKKMLPGKKQYVTKNVTVPKYDVVASSRTGLGPEKTNPVRDGTLMAKTNDPLKSNAQTSRAPSTTRKKETRTKSKVTQQSKPHSVEIIPKVSGAKLAQMGEVRKQPHSHVIQDFIPSTRTSFDTRVPNTTPVYIDTEALFELNESRRKFSS